MFPAIFFLNTSSKKINLIQKRSLISKITTSNPDISSLIEQSVNWHQQQHNQFNSILTEKKQSHTLSALVYCTEHTPKPTKLRSVKCDYSWSIYGQHSERISNYLEDPLRMWVSQAF